MERSKDSNKCFCCFEGFASTVRSPSVMSYITVVSQAPETHMAQDEVSEAEWRAWQMLMDDFTGFIAFDSRSGLIIF